MVWWRRRRRGDSSASTAVLESILVGFVVVGAVVFVTSQTSPPTVQTNSRATLGTGGEDALAVLKELPADNPAYESLLEELVTDGLRGDCTEFERKLNAYYPPGVVYGVYLENGYGGRKTVCETGEAEGEKVVTSTTVQPHWSALIAVANVSQVSGIADVDLLGNVVDLDPLAFHGVLVLNSYIDHDAGVILTFPNGNTTTLNTYNGMRYTGSLRPEHVSALGKQTGYAVPYVTNGDYVAYSASTADLLQAEASYDVEHNLDVGALPSGMYAVHPNYTLSASISTLLDSVAPADRFQPDAPNKGRGDKNAVFKWNYGLVTSSLSSLKFLDGELTVYSPAGARTFNDKVPSVAANRSVPLDDSALWGTYVAHLRFELQQVDELGLPTGSVYVVNQLSTFDVNPPGWLELPDHIPPTYRLSISAGFPDWT